MISALPSSRIVLATNARGIHYGYGEEHPDEAVVVAYEPPTGGKVVFITCDNVRDVTLNQMYKNAVKWAAIKKPLHIKAAELAIEVIGAEYTWGGNGWNWSVALDEKGELKVLGWKGGRFLTASEIKSGYYYYSKEKGKVEKGYGLDCSGLVYWAYNKGYEATTYAPYEGYVVNKKTQTATFDKNPVAFTGAHLQYRCNSEPVEEANLMPGDLLFFDAEIRRLKKYGQDGEIDHVAIYTGPFLDIGKDLRTEIKIQRKSTEDYVNYFFTTWMDIKKEGVWNFAIDGDDAIEVEIDGKVVVSWYGDHSFCGSYEHQGSIYLTVGWHKLIVRHEEDAGEEGVILYFKAPDDAEWNIFNVLKLKGKANLYAYLTPDSIVKTKDFVKNGFSSHEEEISYGEEKVKRVFGTILFVKYAGKPGHPLTHDEIIDDYDFNVIKPEEYDVVEATGSVGKIIHTKINVIKERIASFAGEKSFVGFCRVKFPITISIKELENMGIVVRSPKDPPVDLIVSDPEGLTITKDILELYNMLYLETDVNEDGVLDDIVIVIDRKMGDYLVTLVPEPDATPTDIYTLEIWFNGTTSLLAEDVQIINIPTQPYIVRSCEKEVIPIIPSALDFDPDTLNLSSNGAWVTVYIELPIGHGYDLNNINVSTILVNETIPIDSKAPTSIGDHDNDSIPDLMVKFERSKVISYILSKVNVTELIGKRFIKITLVITGYLNDGKLFQGSDIIKIILLRGRIV
jgi:hypothetical protein